MGVISKPQREQRQPRHVTIYGHNGSDGPLGLPGPQISEIHEPVCDSSSTTTNELPCDMYKFDDCDILYEIIITLNGGQSQKKFPFEYPCAICLVDLKDQYMVSQCGFHYFHRNCLLKNIIEYNRDKCPGCPS